MQTYAVCVKDGKVKHVIDVTDEYLSATGSSYGLSDPEEAIKAMTAEQYGDDLDIAIVHANDDSEAIQEARKELEIDPLRELEAFRAHWE